MGADGNGGNRLSASFELDFSGLANGLAPEVAKIKQMIVDGTTVDIAKGMTGQVQSIQQAFSQLSDSIAHLKFSTAVFGKDGEQVQTILHGISKEGAHIKEVFDKDGEAVRSTITQVGDLSAKVKEANALFKKITDEYKVMQSLFNARSKYGKGTEEYQGYTERIKKQRESIEAMKQEIKQIDAVIVARSNLAKLSAFEKKTNAAITGQKDALEAKRVYDQLVETYQRIAAKKVEVDKIKLSGGDTKKVKDELDALVKTYDQLITRAKGFSMDAKTSAGFANLEKRQKAIDLGAEVAMAKNEQEAVAAVNALYAHQRDVLQRLYEVKTSLYKTQEGTEEHRRLAEQASELQRVKQINEETIRSIDERIVKQSELVTLGKQERDMQEKYDRDARAIDETKATKNYNEQIQLLNRIRDIKKEILKNSTDGTGLSESGRIASLQYLYDDIDKCTERLRVLRTEAKTFSQEALNASGLATVGEYEKRMDAETSRLEAAKKTEYANTLYKEQVALINEIIDKQIQLLGVTKNKDETDRINGEIAALGAKKTANQEAIGKIDEEIVKRSNLINISQAQAEADQRLATAKAAAAREAYENPEALRTAQDALKRMTEAVKEYQKARSVGDKESMNYWKNTAQQAAGVIKSLDVTQLRDAMPVEKYNQLLEIIRQCDREQRNLNTDMLGANRAAENLVNRMGMYLRMLATRTLRKMWSDAKQYVKDYADALNEIRVVTMASEADIERMGTKYRDIAKEMMVSSSEVAQAAVTFWRQGLDETEVNKRLEATIKLSKVAALEFTEAADLLTAASNSFGEEAEHISDVWITVGDNAGTSAAEVGTAMQKASGTASQFGLSVEWLASYIATISERTRESAESIGAAVSTMLARLHSIKAKGYNEEDDTKINDVAKALGTVNVALLDNEGNWRDFSDVLIDIAAKWDTMTDKQQSYIATTLGGTRQQNRLLVLLQDIAKGADGGSRAFQLYEQAMNSAGTTMDKYAIWQESIAAAQGNLKASLEEMYSILQADFLKGVYNFFAGFIDNMNAVTEATNGWNFALGAIIGSLIIVIKYGKQILAALTTFTTAHPIGATVTAIVAGVLIINQVVGAIINNMDTAQKRVAQYGEMIDKANSKLSTEKRFNELKEQYDELDKKVFKTAEDMQRMNDIRAEMYSIVDELKGETTEWGSLTQAVEAYNAEMDRARETKALYLNATLREQKRVVEDSYVGPTFTAKFLGRTSTDNTSEKNQKRIRELEKQIEYMRARNAQKQWWQIKEDESILKEELEARKKSEEEYAKTRADSMLEVKNYENTWLEYINMSKEAGKKTALAFAESFDLQAAMDEMGTGAMTAYDEVIETLLSNKGVEKLQEDMTSTFDKWISGDTTVKLQDVRNSVVAWRNVIATASGDLMKYASLEDEYYTKWVNETSAVQTSAAKYGETMDVSALDPSEYDELKKRVDLLDELAERKLPGLEKGSEGIRKLYQGLKDGTMTEADIKRIGNYADELSRIETYTREISKSGNVDISARPVVMGSAMKQAGYDGFADDQHVVLAAQSIQREFEDMAPIAINFTPILLDDGRGVPLTQEEVGAYFEKLFDGYDGSIESILELDKNGIQLGEEFGGKFIKGLIIGATANKDDFDRFMSDEKQGYEMLVNTYGNKRGVDTESRIVPYNFVDPTQTFTQYVQDYISGSREITAASEETAKAVTTSLSVSTEGTKEAIEDTKAYTDAIELAMKTAQDAANKKALELSQKDNHVTTLTDLRNTLGRGDDAGIQAFKEAWTLGGEDLQKELMGLYPEIANFVAGLDDVVAGSEEAKAGVDALTKAINAAKKVTIDEMRKDAWGTDTWYGRNFIRKSEDSGYANIAEGVKEIAQRGGNVKAYLEGLRASYESVYDGFKNAMGANFDILLQDGAAVVDIVGNIDEAFANTGEKFSYTAKEIDDIIQASGNALRDAQLEKDLLGDENNAFTKTIDKMKEAISGKEDMVDLLNLWTRFGEARQNALNQAYGTNVIGDIESLYGGKSVTVGGVEYETLDAYFDSMQNGALKIQAVTNATKEYVDQKKQQLEAEKALEQSQKDNHEAVLKALRDALGSGDKTGIDAFTEKWTSMTPELQQALIDLYPNIGTFVSKLDEIKASGEGAATGVDALTMAANRAGQIKIDEARKDVWGYTNYDDYLYAKESRDSGYRNVAKTVTDIIAAGGSTANYLTVLKEKLPDVHDGFMGLSEDLNVLYSDSATAEERMNALAIAFDVTGEHAVKTEDEIAKMAGALEQTLKENKLTELFRGDEDNYYQKTVDYLQKAATEGKDAFLRAWDDIGSEAQNGLLKMTGRNVLQDAMDIFGGGLKIDETLFLDVANYLAMMKEGNKVSQEGIFVTQARIDKAKEYAEALKKEAAAEKQLKESQKDNHVGTLGKLLGAAGEGGQAGANAFIKEWDKLLPSLQNELTTLYPSLIQVISAMSAVAESGGTSAKGVKLLTEALEKANAVSLKGLQQEAWDGAKTIEQYKFIQGSKDAGYTNIVDAMKMSLYNGGTASGFLKVLATENEGAYKSVYDGFMALSPRFKELLDDTISNHEALEILRLGLSEIGKTALVTAEDFKKLAEEGAKALESMELDDALLNDEEKYWAGSIKYLQDYVQKMQEAGQDVRTALTGGLGKLGSSRQDGIMEFFGRDMYTDVDKILGGEAVEGISTLQGYFEAFQKGGLFYERGLTELVEERIRLRAKEYEEAQITTKMEEDGYKSALDNLEKLIAAKGDANAAIREMTETDPLGLDAMMKKFPYLYQLYSLDGAGAADGQQLINKARAEGLKTLKEQVKEQVKQEEVEKRLAAAGENRNKIALQLLKEAWDAENAKGVQEMWQMLGSDTTDALIKAYGTELVDALGNAEKGASNLGLALDSLAKKDAPAAVNMAEQLKTSLKTATDAIGTYSSAQESYAKSGYLTVETYEALIKANKDYAKAIDFSRGVYKLDAREAKQINSEKLKAIKDEAEAREAAAIKEYIANRNEMDAKKAEGDMASVEALGKRNKELSEQINAFRAIRSEINGATSAYAQYLEAGNTANPSDMFESTKAMSDTLQESIKSGKMFNDDVESIAGYYKGDGYSLSGDPKERKKQLQALIKEADKYEKSYKNIVKDLKKQDGVTIDGFNISFADGLSIDDLARDWGLSPEYVQDLLNNLSEYGYKIDLKNLMFETHKEDWVNELSEDIRSGIKSSVDAIEDATTLEKGARGDNVLSMQKFINKLRGEDSQIKEDGIYGSETKGAVDQFLEENKETIEKLRKWKEDWEKAIEGGDTTQIDALEEEYTGLVTSLGELSGTDIDPENLPDINEILDAITFDPEETETPEIPPVFAQYKEFLEAINELDLGALTEGMPSIEELTAKIMGDGGEKLSTEATDAMQKALGEVSREIRNIVTTMTNDEKSLKETKERLKKSLEEFFTSFYGAYDKSTADTKIEEFKTSFGALEGWNPFGTIAQDASGVANAIGEAAASAEEIKGKNMGDLGTGAMCISLDAVLIKLKKIQDYTFTDKSIKVTVSEERQSSARGSDGSKTGQSFVSEEGRELIYRKNRGVVELANSMQLTTLEPGDRVYTNEETERILSRRDMTVFSGFAGGKKGDKKFKKELEELQKELERINKEISYNDAARSYHDIRNELDAVRHYILQNLGESEAREAKTREIIDKLEDRLSELMDRQDKYKEGSKKWKKLQKQIDETSDSLTDYRKELIDTMTEQERLNQEIEETIRKERQAQIDVEEEILSAIKEREELAKSMLEGRIALEDLVLKTLEENAKKEKEIATSTADTRIDVLNKEIEKIDELLSARKKLADEEDKQKELDGLEGQLARMTADPTRAKERLELEKKIADLRKEMAWDIAEKEAEARKKALKDQIQNIEEYKEELTGNDEEIDRADLVAQMEEVLKGTDEEIIAWLKQHNKEYAESTKAAQENIERGWKDTVNRMRGITETYWDEVDEIIGRGQDGILEFLKENSSKYREASRRQAEEYVDGWKEVLEKSGLFDEDGNLLKEPRQTEPITEADEDLNDEGNPTKILEIEEMDYQYGYKNKQGKWVKTGYNESKEAAFRQALQAALEYWNEDDYPGSYGKKARKALGNATMDSPGGYIKKFSAGGIVDYTGLAMVHGSSTRPEAFLSANDTKLIAAFTQALHEQARIQVPTLSWLGANPVNKYADGSITMGDIIVQIEKVENEQDVQELARLVGEAIVDGSRRGLAPAW